MSALRNREIKLMLILTISVLLLNSCKNISKSGTPDQFVNPLTKTFDTKIDTSYRLKPAQGIRGIFEDRSNNLWFSSTEYVCRFDGTEFKYFTEEDGLKGIGLVHEDQNGKIWVESGFEVYSFDPALEGTGGERFISHNLTPDTTGNKWEASPNDLWFQKGIPRFGNSEGPPGVYRFHAGAIDFLPFPLSKTHNDDNLYYPTTKAIHGKDGTIWFGTMQKVIGFKNGKFTIIGRDEMGRQDDPNQIGIRGLYADNEGKIWMADNGSGVFVYDDDTTINFTKLHKLDKGEKNGNTLHRAFSISEDNEGNMWFGTVYSGIWRYDGNSLTNYAEKDGVISDNIWTIYKTRKGDLLFAGENPAAVYKFNDESFYRVY